MSTPTRSSGFDVDTGGSRLTVEGVSWFRLAALVGLGVLTWSYVEVLLGVTRVVGGSSLLWSVVIASVLGGILAARWIPEWVAGLIAVVALAGGYAYYLLVTPQGLEVLVTAADHLIADALALLTGLSVLQMIRADVWAIGFAPAPIFFSWYLVVRRRYLAGAVVGGLALSVLVLTGDVGEVMTLAGVLGGIGAVGFGELDRRGGTLLQADVLVVLVALITITSLTLSIVPGGAADPLMIGGQGSPGTVEASLTTNPDRAPILGAIELSPKVRFTVDAEKPAYWRVGTYDRYTGGSWVRTGQNRDYEGPDTIPDPAGDRERLVQTYTIEGEFRSMPAASQPVEVIGDASSVTEVTAHGALQSTTAFREGDRYRVVSAVSEASAETLAETGTDYPEWVTDRYLQLPESTPDRLTERTTEITQAAENPYETAKLIETYLENNKGYSLNIERPSGDIAANFLFEMEEGYCVYFATTMVTMLRSQGIPARMAVGYTTGQQIGEDEYVVRGLDSHAWVEVYFPDQGWVQFDPTPATPRRNAELEAIQGARESGGNQGVDIPESANQTITTIPTTGGGGGFNDTVPGFTTPRRNPFDTTGGGGNGTVGPINGTTSATSPPANESGGGIPLPPLPSRRNTAIGLVVLLGAAAGAHRSGLAGRAYQTARIRWQGRQDTPEATVERAYERLELILARRYRPRETGETPRHYVASLGVVGVDERAREVLQIHEQARYAGNVDEQQARRAVQLVDELAKQETPIIGYFRR